MPGFLFNGVRLNDKLEESSGFRPYLHMVWEYWTVANVRREIESESIKIAKQQITRPQLALHNLFESSNNGLLCKDITSFRGFKI